MSERICRLSLYTNKILFDLTLIDISDWSYMFEFNTDLYTYAPPATVINWMFGAVIWRLADDFFCGGNVRMFGTPQFVSNTPNPMAPAELLILLIACWPHSDFKTVEAIGLYSFAEISCIGLNSQFKLYHNDGFSVQNLKKFLRL